MRLVRTFTQNLLSENGAPKTYAVLRRGVEEKVSPGFVAGFWMVRFPEQIHVVALGNADPDTYFDLASVSKVFATAPLATVLVEQGWLDWETPVKKILPHMPYPEIKLSHLLSHTAGFPAHLPYWKNFEEELSVSERQSRMRKLIFETKLTHAPGTTALYSDITFLLLGFALEEITQMPLDQAVRKFLWEPMGLDKPFYQRWDQKIRVERVNDENAWAMGGYGGHAGVFARACDLLSFGAQLLGGFFTQDTLKKMATPVLGSRTLGWDTPSGSNPSVGKYFSNHTIGHLGFTGTSFWIDIEAGLVVTLLSNRIYYGVENEKIREFRPRFHNALREDLASFA